jgi:hypothetical protein
MPHDSKRRRAMAALTKGGRIALAALAYDDEDDETIIYV